MLVRCEDARTVVRGERLMLRPAVAEDAEALAAMFEDPDVAEWWHS